MIAYFGRKLGENGHRISSDQICTMTEAWVAESGAKAMEEYGPYFLYFNNVLWHHGGNPPGQKANPVAAGYVKSSSYDYVRPENAAEAVIDREIFRALNREDVEAKVASGELAFGNPKEVTERLIEQAEAVGANKMLVNLNFGAMPNDLFMEQVRRFGRDVLPKLQAHQVTRIPAVS
jgi:alkanesulfonate monooxygenase SsuD/methylene tetrahydromethanopterin reductase-like flavin-dependent oxidoreductase (luciferase family)